MWSERYRPQSIPEMVGNEEARASILEWFTKWRPGAKPLLLVGPPGTGKTTIAFIVARQFGYDAISLNASDVRSKSRINEVLAPVLGNASILGAPMIFVDEVDGIHGRYDFGGAAALIDILKEATVPIILAANSNDADKMKNISKAAKTIQFKKIPPRLLRVYLEHILDKEGAVLSPGSLVKVIDKSRGDIRSMINLAQSFVTGFNPQVEAAFERINIGDGVDAFFKAKSVQEARGVLYSINVNPRDKINAFYSSIITSNVDAKTLARCLRVISDADILYGRIMRTQSWRLLRYLDGILIRLYHTNSSIRYSQYNLPWPLLNRIRWDAKKIASLCGMMAKRQHISSSAFAAIGLPYFLSCIKNKALEPHADAHQEIIQKEIERLR